jgi:uncharacterized protein
MESITTNRKSIENKKFFGYNLIVGDTMIKRDYYLNKLVDYKDKDIIKIITGIRRCGKSYLLFNIYYDYLISIGVKKENVIKINLESIRYEKLRDPNNLFNYLESVILPNERYYIFLDEIQLLDKFEDVVNGIKTDFNCDLYITGSNSKLLSSEINTKLRGRGIEIKLYPLSFKEFYDGVSDKKVAFNNYIKYGGLPYINSLDKEYEKKEYLQMLNDTVATKDIIERNNIRNEVVFNAVIDLLCSSIGSYVSPNKIANTLISNGFKTVDNDAVSNYLKYLCDAFLFYKAVRYDLKGKEYLKTLNKYYVCDLGLRNQKLGYRQIEMSHILENVVYLELIRRNYQVDIGKNKDSEIDFVVRTDDDLYYIQVSLSIEDEDTKKRELRSFNGLDDGYKKIVITMDENPLTKLEKGYKMLNIFDFLLNEDSLFLV